MSEWSYRKGITIDSAKVGGDLTDFPVVIHLNNDSGLADHAQSSGDDIKFEDTNGNQLSHEIEAYDGSTGTLWAHVKLPSLSSATDTTIYLYYGNPDAANQESVADVWSNGFDAVYHLTESASGVGNVGVYRDSTGNNRHGDDYVSATGQEGVLSDGQSFDPSADDYINTGFEETIDDDSFTISAWFQTNSTQYGTIVDTYDGRPQVSLQYNELLGGMDFRVDGGGLVTTSGGVLKKGVPHFVAGVRDADTFKIHVDGDRREKKTKGLNSDLTKGQPFWIGRRPDDRATMDGFIDEVRFASVSRSEAWITTTYNNQNNPLSFYTIGGVESLNNRAITTTGSETTSLSTQTATRNAPASAVSGATVQSTVSNVSATAVDATATTGLTATLQTPSVAALTPTALTTETATTATEQARASVTTAKSTAIETKSRILKFADATATATVSLEVSVPPPNTPAAALITASPRAALTPRKTTPHRRALDGTSDTDAAYETDSDRVEYDEKTDEIEYDTR